jgi:hypothetical protein
MYPFVAVAVKGIQAQIQIARLLDAGLLQASGKAGFVFLQRFFEPRIG